MRPKAFSYLRFSTPEQMHGDSYRRQTALAEDYARLHGLELDASLNLNDFGVSGYFGKNAKVGALGRFLRAIEDRAVPPGSFLLIENIDRLSRQDAWDAMPIVQNILNAGITLVTLQDGREFSRERMRENPFLLFELLLGMIRANQESATKARRLKAAWTGKRMKASERPLTARVPAWIELDKATGTFRLIPERAEIVRRIFAMLADGVGQHRIAETLNREDIPTFGDNGTKRKAEMWHRSYIAKIADSPAVIGTLVPHELERVDGDRKRRKPLEPIPGYYPAAVDREQYDRVQALRMIIGKAPIVRGEAGTVRSLVAGLAKCPRCGGTMTRVYKGNPAKAGAPKLVCVRAKAGAGCAYHSVPLADVEGVILANLGTLIDRVPSGDAALEDRISDVRSEVEGLGEGINNIALAIRRDPSPRLSADLRELEAKYERKEAELTELERRAQTASKAALVRRLQELEAMVMDTGEPLDVAKANALLRQVFDAVVVDYDKGELVFRWKSGGPDGWLFLPEKDGWVYEPDKAA